MFLLSKWYLDCVTDEGAAVALYWASLRWGIAHLHYGAALVRLPSGHQAARYTLRPGTEPVNRGHELEWSCRRLDAHGTWTPRAQPVARTLLETPGGSVRWNCASPRADAVVHLGGETLRGTGYVEHLTMTLPPWRLPFHALRWGRFHAPGWTIVWIDWRGNVARTWVFANGVERRDATVGTTSLALTADGCSLWLGEGTILRSGRLRGTGLRPLRPLALLLPRWRAARETKWLAQATFSGPGVSATGWALHEEVTWP
jgi:hypothetical protein